MFGYDTLLDIRKLEAFLYEGPETVEQIYGRSDSFSSKHMRRRYHKDTNDVLENFNKRDIWYTYHYDKELDDIVYNIIKK